jgi:hypothetical protein
MKNNILYLVLLVLLASCFKEDEPMPAFEMQSTTIEMGQYYRYQSYFNLATNEVISTNDRNLWDLGFECGDSSWHIILNTSAFEVIANSGITDFDQPIDTIGFDWRFDKSDGDPDSTAVGQWLAISGEDTTYFNHVFVLDRGYDHVGKPRGLRKVAFTRVDSVSYSFRYSDLNGDNYNEFMVFKRDGVYFTMFSFADGGKQLDLEPRTDSWDLFFTQYTTLLYTNEGVPYPYLVTGVLTNYGRIETAMDSTRSYDAVDRAFAQSLDYSRNRDFIGYEWKELIGDVNSGNVFYEIVPGRNYLVRTAQGLYFKIRFINFYSETGEKGYPSFQYDVL